MRTWNGAAADLPPLASHWESYGVVFTKIELIIILIYLEIDANW